MKARRLITPVLVVAALVAAAITADPPPAAVELEQPSAEVAP